MSNTNPAKAYEAYGSGRYEEAVELYTIIIKNCDQNSSNGVVVESYVQDEVIDDVKSFYYTSRAKVYEMLNKNKEAIEDCDKAIFLNTHNAAARECAARCATKERAIELQLDFDKLII